MPPRGVATDDEDEDEDEDEFAVIERLRRRFEAPGSQTIEVGIGDDAAVIAPASPEGGRLVVSVDLLVEDVHVDLRLSRMDDAGWKAMMVAASDIAAMGAVPRYALVGVAAPSGYDLDAFGAGIAEASAALGCAVVGGDLSAGPALVASVTVAGVLPSDGRPPLLRSSACPGDLLFVTGRLGGSAAGLRRLRAGGSRTGALADAYLRPRAPVAEGAAARRGGATAAIDVSDGLAADARHVAESSGVGLVVDAVPAAEGATDAEALGGGEDYVLLVAAPDRSRLLAAFAESRLPEPLPVGRCTDEQGRYLLGDAELPPAGWRHRF